MSRGRKTVVFSPRIDVRTFAHMVMLVEREGINTGGNASEVIRIVLESIEEQNIKKEERIMLTEDALHFVANRGYSMKQAMPEDSRNRPILKQMRAEQLSEMQHEMRGQQRKRQFADAFDEAARIAGISVPPVEEQDVDAHLDDFGKLPEELEQT